MYRSDNFRQKETIGHAFTHSCVGRILIVIAIIIVLLIIAAITKPSKKTMIRYTTDGILECIENNDSIRGDQIDDYITNIGHVFTHADTSKINRELLEGLSKYNRMDIHNHAFFRTAYIHNNMHPEGVRVAWGAFGIVLPTVTYGDLLLYVGKMHGGYNQKVIKSGGADDFDMGVTPNVQPYHYKGDPED